jgi:1A family penicillin-binding protein
MTERRPPSPKRAPSRAARPRKPTVRRSVLWRWRRGIFLSGLIGVASVGGAASLVFSIDLPPEEALLQTSFVCAADVTEGCGPDNAIASFSAEEDRINVRLDDLPDVLIDAVLATEDRDFFEHGGIDPVGIGRALYNDVRGRGVQQGGSTITQQYVKNAYLTSERTLTRKIKEAVLAVKLERELDKEEILERYLNTIYFGRGAYGVGAAARAYFGKDVRHLGLPEVSYLAGLIRAPESADARNDVDEASRRRSTVLRAMQQEGYITGEEAEAIAALPWDYVIPRRDRTGLGDVKGNNDELNIGTKYFVEAVRRQIAAEYGEDMLYGGGLRIYTTLDFDMQTAAWEAITSTLTEPDDPAAALVAVDEYGQVKALVGGRDFDTSELNLALGRAGGGSGRGPGSTFKPFVLAEAIRQGISLNSRFEAPGRIVIPRANAGDDWTVSNYGGTEQGVLDLVDATRVSSNTAYAQLMLEVGPEAVADLAERMGITADLPPVNSLVLGTGDLSPLDMASAYSTFANRGVHNDPVLVSKIEQVDEDGDVTVIEQHTPSGDRVLSEQEADLVTYCLRQVLLGGTGSSANFGKPAAGKTGTTQDNRDAWFAGFTPRLTAAVWMGYDNPPGTPTRYMDDVHGIEVTGGSFPAQIWRRFMADATRGMDTGSFVTPRTFPGRLLNSDLEIETTTTTSEEDGSSTSSSSTSSTGSTSTTEGDGPGSTSTTRDRTSTTTSTTRPGDEPTTSTTGVVAPVING